MSGQNRSGDGSCKPCEPGSYTSSTNTTQCTSCPAGKSTRAAGSTDVTMCEPCETGKYSLPGTPCTACLSGKFADAATVVGQRGTLVATESNLLHSFAATQPPRFWGSSACATCAAGTFSHEGASVCSPCPYGSLSPAGSGNLSACTCKPGFYGEDGETCRPCPSGTFKDEAGAMACTACAEDFGWSPTASRDSRSCESNRRHGFHRMLLNASACSETCHAESSAPFRPP